MKSGVSYLLPQQRNKSKGSEFWYGGISCGGKVRWESLKTKKKSEAMAWYAKMQASRFMPPGQQEAAPVELGGAINAFLLDVENVRRRVPGTVKLYGNYLSQLKAFCDKRGASDLRDITPQLCSDFALEAFAELSAYTAKNKVILFRHFFGWAYDRHGIQGRNPFKKIVVAKPKPRPRDFWTIEECEKIIAAAPSGEYRCWFALMAFAGLRKEEARHLSMESLDLPGRKISLVGKGGKAAKLPISQRLMGHISRYLADRGAEPGTLFPALSKLSKAKDEAIHEAALKSGIAGGGMAHYHRFRHSFASNLLRLGRSIKAVQMLMRHENVTLTLDTYGHLLPSDLEEAAEM